MCRTFDIDLYISIFYTLNYNYKLNSLYSLNLLSYIIYYKLFFNLFILLDTL